MSEQQPEPVEDVEAPPVLRTLLVRGVTTEAVMLGGTYDGGVIVEAREAEPGDFADAAEGDEVLDEGVPRFGVVLTLRTD